MLKLYAVTVEITPNRENIIISFLVKLYITYITINEISSTLTNERIISFVIELYVTINEITSTDEKELFHFL